MRFRVAVMMACGVHTTALAAQRSGLSRNDVIQTALQRGARLGVAKADTAVAVAGLITARARPNPSISTSYSKSVPNYHVAFDVPFDLPGVRRLRVRAAELGLSAAQFRYLFARASIILDADTIYTHAIAAREHLVLSRRNALDADSLLRMVERRRDAGDASDMDVELARVNAGREANVAAADSLTLVSTLLDLQALIGMSSERVEVVPADSLALPPAAEAPGRTLNEIAASTALESANLAAQLQRRSLWSTPSVSLGFEFKDPDQPGLLPTFGVGLGLPLFDRNRGAIAQAEAERVRAAAELTLAQIEARNEIAHAQRERESALARVTRDQLLVASANRVVAMSLTAYREGASSLANVLEAQRTSRDLLLQYIDDLAAAWVATAELRALAASPSSSTRP